MWESTYQQELRASVRVDWTVDCTVAYPHGTQRDGSRSLPILGYPVTMMLEY